MNKLEGTQYRFLRTIAGKTWRDHPSYVQLLRQTTKDMYNNNFDWANDTNRGISITAIETYCRLARLRYAGHIARMSKSRIPNIVLHGEVDEGFRRPGRPKKSFREGLRNDLKAFQLWPKYIAQKKLIDWSKTEKNGEKQLTQLRKKSRNNGNKQRLIQAMKENKWKSRNVRVFTDHFYD